MRKILVLVMLMTAFAYLAAGEYYITEESDITITCSPKIFEESTRISIEIPETTDTEIYILDSDNNIVRIFAKRNLIAGTYDFVWDGKGDFGQDLKPGDYFIAVKTNFTYVKVKVILK